MTDNKPWSELELNKLKKMAKSGMSASAMAAELPGRTRNAVIGFMKRNGIENKHFTPEEKQRRKERIAAITKPKRIRKAKPKVFVQKILPPPAPIELAVEEIITGNKILTELGFTDCRAVIGEISGLDTRYCGRPTDIGYSWCQYHRKLYLVPIVPRGR
jgi:hypothetical protein